MESIISQFIDIIDAMNNHIQQLKRDNAATERELEELKRKKSKKEPKQQLDLEDGEDEQ